MLAINCVVREIVVRDAEKQNVPEEEHEGLQVHPPRGHVAAGRGCKRHGSVGRSQSPRRSQGRARTAQVSQGCGYAKGSAFHAVRVSLKQNSTWGALEDGRPIFCQ